MPALRGQLKTSLMGGILGSVPISLLAGADAGLIYLLYLALPCCYLAQRALLCHKQESGGLTWYPPALALLQISLVGMITIALMTIHHASAEGGIMGVISQQVEAGFADMEPEMSAMVKQLASHWSFLIFGLTVWMWVLLLYGHLWAANRLIKTNRLRESVAIEPFAMPGWVLSLMAICALASLIGSPSMQFFGKASLVCLMLPYFLLGCALMHAASKSWPSRGFFLFFVYSIIITQFWQLWPLMILSAYGFFHHMKSLSGGSTSARS